MTHTPDTLLDFDGANQPIAEHALDYGIPAFRIVMRLNAGWSVEDAITRPVYTSGRSIGRKRPRPAKQPRKTPTYTYNGMTLSAKEWAAHFGVTESLIYSRLRLYGSVAPRSHACQARRYTHDGMTLTLAEWSKRLGISASTLRHRLGAGYAPEAVFSAKRPPGHNAIMVTMDGITDSLLGWCRRLGMSRSTVFNRVANGMSLEEALTAPHRSVKLTYNGETRTTKEWSELTGIRRGTILLRLRRGLSAAEVLAPVPPQRSRKRNPETNLERGGG